MTVRLLAACWLFLLVKSYEISFRTHGQFTNFSALRGGEACEEEAALSNELLPSNLFFFFFFLLLLFLLSPRISSSLALMRPALSAALMPDEEATRGGRAVVTPM